MPPPPKQRKLTHKQMVKLLKGLVAPVEANSFEKFFSENYQRDEGEGYFNGHTLKIKMSIY